MDVDFLSLKGQSKDKKKSVKLKQKLRQQADSVQKAQTTEGLKETQPKTNGNKTPMTKQTKAKTELGKELVKPNTKSKKSKPTKFAGLFMIVILPQFRVSLVQELTKADL